MASLDVPTSSTTVRVRMFDTTTNMVVHAGMFVEPVLPGHEVLNLSTVGFLIEHEGMGKKVVFDLGARKDFWNYAPFMTDRIPKVCKGLKVEHEAHEILQNAGIDLNSISESCIANALIFNRKHLLIEPLIPFIILASVIWSHMHWDHTGNINTFPATTELVVGPNFMSTFLPGYPSDTDGRVLEEWFEERSLREVSFLSGHHVFGFPAFDFFGDGSFYLLDTPGHCVAHICGLARTTPDTFVLMGGDICHFPGSFKPNASLPIPDGSLECITSNQSPVYTVTRSEHSAYVERDRAIDDIKKLEILDGSPNVLICIAHDTSLTTFLPTLNASPSEDLNSWKSKGYKEKCLWGFLDELPKHGQPGRRPLVEGIWKEGNTVHSLS